MLISTASLNALRVGIKNSWTAGYQGVSEGELWYKMLADETTSEDASEIYRLQTTLFRLREWLGPRVVENLTEKSVTLLNKEFEKTFGIKVTDVEDDKFGNMDNGLKNLGRAGRLWPNDCIYDAIVAGGATICYDGQFFFDTDHPCAVGAVQANLNTTTALTAANYTTVRTAMMKRRSDDGKPLQVRPSHLIVPPDLEITAKMIVEAEMVGYLRNTSSTATDSNVLKGTTQVMVIPELASDSTTTWYLADLLKPVKPFIMQFRVHPEVPTILNRPNDQGVFEEGLIKVGTRARGAGGYGLWQLIDKCTA